MSYNKIGGVQEAQGDLTGALKSYRDGFAIIDRLAKFDPGNAGWQLDLSASYVYIGGVQEAQGDLTGALKSYRDGLAIIDRLAKSDPGNAGWQLDSVGVLRLYRRRAGSAGRPRRRAQISAACRKRRATSPARSNRIATVLRSSTAWRNPIPATPAGSAICRRLYVYIGGVQEAQGDLTGALKSYRDGFAIIDRLAKSDPGNAGWQLDLWVSYAKLATAYGKSSETAKAREALVSGRAIIVKLVEQHPEWAQWKRDLAWFDAQIAELGRAPQKRPRSREPLPRRAQP